jgi:hypothetical protein
MIAQNAEGGEDGRFFVLAAASTAAAVAIVFVLAPTRFHFWYDSWTYFELARSFGRDFYAVSTIREFQTNSPYSSAFPPLWPAIIATFGLFGVGMFGSYLASFISFGLFAAAAERLARRVFARRGVGLLSVLLLLAFPGMRWDLAGGGSVALSLCLLALLGRILFDFDPRSYLHAVLIGAIAGCMVMLRFDALPAALAALLCGVAFGMRRSRLLVLGVSFALCISPWVLYSWSHFHQPFVTDNRAVALALDPDAYVMDYHPTQRPALRDDPAAWAAKLVVHMPILARALFNALVQSVFFLPIWVAAAVAAVARVRRAHLANGAVPAALLSRPSLALAAIGVAPIAAYVVTGYQESRYFSSFIWMGELAALGLLTAVVSPRTRVVVAGLACAAGLGKSVSLLRYLPQGNPIAIMGAQLSTSDADSLVSCLRHAGANPHEGILFQTNVALLNGYRFGALTGWRASPPPRNWSALTPEQRATFARTFRLSFVLDTLPSASDRLPSAPLPGCALAVRRLTGEWN